MSDPAVPATIAGGSLRGKMERNRIESVVGLILQTPTGFYGKRSANATTITLKQLFDALSATNPLYDVNMNTRGQDGRPKKSPLGSGLKTISWRRIVETGKIMLFANIYVQ